MSASHTNDANIIQFQDINVSINKTDILKRVTARVPKGSWTAIVGPNGAGKTTLLLTLLGQVPYQGKILKHSQFNSSELSIGYVPQNLNFDRNLPLTVLEFMAIGHQRLPISLGVRKKYKEEAVELLKSVQADNLLYHKLGDLSGGELKRVLLALALGQEPELLILDEVSSGVDVSGSRVFCELLDDLRRKHKFTQLSVNHDLSTVTHHATHVICLKQSVISEGVPNETLSTETLTKLFGIHMGLVNKNALSSRRASCDGSCCKKETDKNA